MAADYDPWLDLFRDFDGYQDFGSFGQDDMPVDDTGMYDPFPGQDASSLSGDPEFGRPVNDVSGVQEADTAPSMTVPIDQRSELNAPAAPGGLSSLLKTLGSGLGSALSGAKSGLSSLNVNAAPSVMSGGVDKLAPFAAAPLAQPTPMALGDFTPAASNDPGGLDRLFARLTAGR